MTETEPGWTIERRLALPEPVGGVAGIRREHQHWQRLERAEGELEVGYDQAGRPVRVEYHWKRYFSRANPDLADVYTAELWVRRPRGDWLYLVRPTADAFVALPHDSVRQLFKTALNLDAGD